MQVSQVKESIQQDQGESFPSELLVLIYQGKVRNINQLDLLTSRKNYDQEV
jgi:hypothetical protein